MNVIINQPNNTGKTAINNWLNERKRINKYKLKLQRFPTTVPDWWIEPVLFSLNEYKAKWHEQFE